MVIAAGPNHGESLLLNVQRGQLSRMLARHLLTADLLFTDQVFTQTGQ